MRWVDGICLTLSVVLLAAPACPVRLNSPGTPDSGLTGRIFIGPTCPGPVRADDPACQDKPYSATVRVLTEDDLREVVRFTADAEGRFRVPLPPGRYRLVPESQGRYPRAEPQTVTVRPGEWTYVEIHYDSGIR
ncbi:hypothetical protein HRbin11_00776 [bacterium HR11]|nr:hypothetical protein HRbin11_00776 [bacterium HR11]